ncbi:MAG TPA: hypothetical protein DCR97_05195 [Deltaproteobacteria bacterium]|nr:hypothetical protein [Deltaproteobacteria bacterium]
MPLILLLLLVVALNLPFGYWRAGVRRFSPQWFLAVHVPVPLVMTARLITGAGWSLPSVPLVVAAFFGGQVLGSAVHGIYRNRHNG